MKSKDLYSYMIKHRPVWVTYPPKDGALMKCQIVMVGRLESELKADCGAEFRISNRNISDKRPRKD